ncbi:MAG: hypothetical protein EA403_08615 [Spirochaetaceae bacterium]|nr:MAG: hypothetical protein EA403_08615 [Spirochaetaceae bacterium]
MYRLKPTVLFFAPALFLGWMLLASCAGGPPTLPPAVNTRRLTNPDAPIGLAARLFDRVGDLTERIELANEAADAARSSGASDDAGLLLDYARTLIPFAPAHPRTVVAAANTAVQFAAVGRTVDAVQVLEGEFARLAEIPNATDRGAALEAIINVSFLVGDESFDLLTRAVQSIFVMEDLSTRVRLLTETAVLYYRAGNRGTANSLMQQAIPAAGSLADPWQRAAAIGSLAVAHHRTDNRDAAITAVDSAMEELRRGGNGAPTATAAPYLLRILDAVVLLSQQLTAVELVDRIADPETRARGLSGIAVGFGQEGARSAAYIFFSRAAREASLVEDRGGRIRAMTDVASGYLQIGDADLAVIQANGAASVTLQIPDTAEQIAAGGLVMSVYARSRERGRAETFLSDLPEGRVREEVALAFAQQLIAGGQIAEAPANEQMVSDARSILLRYLGSDGAATAISDARTAGAVARAFAQVGDIGNAVRWMNPTADPASTAWALIAIGRVHPQMDSLSPADRDALERVRAAVAAR